MRKIYTKHYNGNSTCHSKGLAYLVKNRLGLLSSGDSPTARLPPLPSLPSNQPIDYLAFFLSHQLAYEPHERDSALLHHSFSLAPTSVQGGGSTTKVTASLLHYGSSEGSAMAVTVGKTLAFAALRVLDGKVKSRGVTGPYEKEVWEGVLDDLEEVGVRVIEDWQV
jgi:alpha-aminoadipic semialdehyde synthase